PAHVRAAFLFACALQRRKRPCAGALILIECPRHGELARAPAIVGTTSGCPLARILTLLLRPLRRFGTGDRGKPARRRCGSRFRSRCGFARRRRFGFGRLGGRFGLRLRRGRAGFGFLARTPVFLSAALFFFKGASALLRLTAGGFLGQAQTIFLGFALQAGDALLRRLARRRGLARRRRRRRRGRRSYRRGRRLRGRGRGWRRSFSGLAGHATALDLDHNLVGPAVAEGLLDLARVDRALEAKRLAFARGVVAVAHKTRFVLQNQFVACTRFEPDIAACRSPGSPPVIAAAGPPRKVCKRRSGIATRSADARSASARWTTLSRPNATDKAARSSGRRIPARPEPSASVPTRQAWSSLRLPSSPASAAW